jgi:hypothetical protein
MIFMIWKVMYTSYSTPKNYLEQEQDKKENVEARSTIKLFPPREEVLQAWKHCDITLWSPLQDIMWTPIPP